MRGSRLLAAAACAGALVQTTPPRQPAPSTLLTVPLADTQPSRTAQAVVNVSANGRYLAFASRARLAPADSDDLLDIYVLDRSTGAVTLESVSADGRALDGDSRYPGLSGDGRYLVFETVVVSSGPSARSVVLRDRLAQVSRHLVRARDGTLPAAVTDQPAISEDGRFVAFSSDAPMLRGSGNDDGMGRALYIYGIDDGTIAAVSVDADGAQPARGHSLDPRISADGRFVAFASSADLLRTGQAGDASASRAGPPEKPELYRVFVRDVRRQVTRCVSEPAGGGAPDGSSGSPAISGDGRYVAFTSDATNLVPRDRNGSGDVFLHDAGTGQLTLVSRTSMGGSANGHSAAPALSADGRIVAFQSDASDLVCARACAASDEDIDLVADVFLMDTRTGVIFEASRDGAVWAEESVAPALDGRGAVLAFASRHPRDGTDLGHDLDLFVSLQPHILALAARAVR
jgi:Tol biopolymer transport system component